MEKEILECILKRNEKDLTTEKVVSMEIVPAVGKLVNKSATLNRFILKLILANGRTAKKSFIVKTASEDEIVAYFTNKWNAFKTETTMYGVLKEFEYLMEEFQDSDDVLWCHMIHHIPYNCIVMEDLKAKGFYMVGEHDLFDLKHSMLTIHALGRYHAICKILEEKGHLSPQGFKNGVIFDYFVSLYIYSYLLALVQGIKKLWDPTWTSLVDKIKITKESFVERLNKLGEVDETKFNVLNHGDCHKFNILFKYDFNKQPIEIRFIDFQMAYYGSPCLDLIYFINHALQPAVRRDNFELLMRTYHNSLLSTLEKYQYKGSKPNFEEIMEGMKKVSFLGLVLFLTGYPNLFMTEEKCHLIDATKLVATEGKEGCSDELFVPDLLVDAMGPDLKQFVELFFSNN